MSSYTGTRCSRCNRPLKNPKWVEVGMGKVCYGKDLVEKAKERARQDIETERGVEHMKTDEPLK